MIDFCKVNSFLVFDPTPYTILGGWKIINLFVCAESRNLTPTPSANKLAPLPGKLKLSCFASLTGFLGVLHPFLCYYYYYFVFVFVSLALLFRILCVACIEGCVHNNHLCCSHRSPKEYISAGEEEEERWPIMWNLLPWRN